MFYSQSGVAVFDENTIYIYPGMFNGIIVYSGEGAQATTTDWWSPDLHRHGQNMGYTGS